MDIFYFLFSIFYFLFLILNWIAETRLKDQLLATIHNKNRK